MPIQLGTYQHFKGGIYKVLGTAKHSESLEEMVLYQSQKDQGLWVRPLKMFLDTVKHNNEVVPRFKYINED